MKFSSPARRSQGGFTLLEIIIVFLLLMLIIGVGAMSLVTERARKQITEPADELKVMARRGLQMAITNRRSFAIALGPGGFSLLEGSAAVGVGAEEAEDFAPMFEEEPARGREIDGFELREGMSLMVRRWGEKFFRAPEGDLWIFEPSGICEPLAIKLLHPEGSIEMLFNPLTAKIQEQSLIIGDEEEGY